MGFASKAGEKSGLEASAPGSEQPEADTNKHHFGEVLLYRLCCPSRAHDILIFCVVEEAL